MAEPPAKYEAWLARQIALAEQPATEQQNRWQELFVTKAESRSEAHLRFLGLD